MSGFVDECNLHVTAGDGGAGCVAFRREAHMARGGPCGGDGGRGGDVWLVADSNTASLLAFRDHPHRRAGNGRHGSGNGRHGARGSDMDVVVPVGTVVLDHDTRDPLVDLAATGDRWRAAQAGTGGRGNARFSSNKHRAPAFAEQGESGEQRWLRLELKLLADVAIIGFPNIGKSTFISRVSAAKPKIADYPFTTLEPNLGVVRIDDTTELVLADIPGLIAGTSEGKGLGYRFLRHIERARVLLVLLDLSPWSTTDPTEQLAVLLNELQSYKPELLRRPRVVAGSRADMAPGSDAGLKGHHKGAMSDQDEECALVPRLSSFTGEGVSTVMGALTRLVAKARANAPQQPPQVVVHRPLGTELTVTRSDDRSWLVHGRAAARAVAVNDLAAAGALAYVQKRLDALGVERALARAGAQPGDTALIGDFEFEFRPDSESAVTSMSTAKRR